MSEREKHTIHEVSKDSMVVGLVGILLGAVSHSGLLLRAGLAFTGIGALGVALT